MDPVQFQPDPPVLAGEQYFVHADVYRSNHRSSSATPERSILTGSPATICNCPITSRRRSLPWPNGSLRAPRHLMIWQLPSPNICATILPIQLQSRILRPAGIHWTGSSSIPRRDSVITMPQLKSSCCAAWEFRPGWWSGLRKVNLSPRMITWSVSGIHMPGRRSISRMLGGLNLSQP